MITSSGAAVLRDTTTPSTFSELNWNEQCLEIVREKGREAPNMMKYRASKTLAEKGTGYRAYSSWTGDSHILTAAWEFWNKHKASVGWDLTVLNPPYVSFFNVRKFNRGRAHPFLNDRSLGYVIHVLLVGFPLVNLFP